MSILASGLAHAPHFLPGVAGTSSSAGAVLAAATMPADDGNLAQWLGLGAALALALVIAWATGVFRPVRVDGPLRLPPGRPLWPLAMVLGVAVLVWVGSSAIYGAAKQIGLDQAGSANGELPASRPAVRLTTVDFAVLSTVPGLLGFVWMFAADRQLARIWQLQLGFTRRRFLDGVAKGLLASLMIMPAMFVAEILLEAMYRELPLPASWRA